MDSYPYKTDKDYNITKVCCTQLKNELIITFLSYKDYAFIESAIRDIEDEENFQKAEAMIQLMCELNAGIRSAEDEGWVTEEELKDHLFSRKSSEK